MKLLCLLTLVVCSLAQGANINNDILPPGKSVETRLEHTSLEFNLVSKDSAVTDDDRLLIEELKSLEKEQDRSLIADVITNVLEGFRDVVINGNDDIPPLDPFVVPLIGPFDYTTLAVAAKASIKDLTVEGLRWYIVDKVSFNALSLSFGLHVTVPWLTITGSYDASARLALLTHNASGNFRIFAHRIELGVDMRLGTNIFGGGHLVLRELDIKIDIHDTNIQIHGMTGSSIINNFINNVVQSITQDIIQSEMQNVSQMISEELFDTINDVLKNYKLSDILG